MLFSGVSFVETAAFATPMVKFSTEALAGRFTLRRRCALWVLFLGTLLALDLLLTFQFVLAIAFLLVLRAVSSIVTHLVA